MSRSKVWLVAVAAARVLTAGQEYSAAWEKIKGVDAVRLAAPGDSAVVFIAPSLGNKAFDFRVNGWAVLAPSGEQPDPAASGIPLLAPWANRLDGDYFWANGKRYLLNPELGTIQYDESHQPLHGLLSAAAWRVVDLRSDADAAKVTSELEFWRNPNWMAQFPFAHRLRMTYRLRDRTLEVRTTIENLATAPMPVVIGYHPYFMIGDAPRNSWKLHLAARERMELSPTKIPTGKRTPVPFSDPLGLKGVYLDDVFTGLVRDAKGNATFSLEGGRQKITIVFGPNYRSAVVYAPASQDIVCIEPMAAPTDALNLAHRGLYDGLQTIAPSGQWSESFWITPEGSTRR
jgi:aldose 1-epimerase